MRLLTQIPGRMRIAVCALFAAGVLGTAAFTAAVLGLGDPRSGGFQALYVSLHLLPGAVCILRAWLVRRERLAWGLVGIGMFSWGGGYAYFFLVLQNLNPPPYPSFADVLWVSYLLACLAAVLLLVRSRLRQARRALWIDAAVGALALGAVAAAVLIGPVFESTDGAFAAVATNLIYPGMDLLIFGLVLGVFALSGGRPGGTWLIVGLAFVIQGGADSLYLFEVASGSYQAGTLLDVTWPIVALLLAFAAWREPEERLGVHLQGWQALGVTAVFTLVGLGLTTYDHYSRINDVALWLATATLVAAFMRATLTFTDMQALARNEQLLAQNELILGAVGEGIYGIDLDGLTTFANAATVALTGYSSEEMLGREQHALIHHTRSDGTPYPAEECPIRAALADGTSHHTAEDLYWRKDGSSFPVEFTATPIEEDGMVTGAVVVFRDITERREVDRMKEEFTSVVSHELRTPLTSIRGSLGLLAGGAVGEMPDKAKRMLDIAVSNTDRLVRLINDILDIERMESGQVVMERREIDLAEVLRAAEEVVGPMAREASVRLDTEPHGARLFADPDRLTQALTNLLSNAIKFSPADAVVSVGARLDGAEVLIEVSDAGRGIPPEKLETIFERFQQVDGSDSREKGGTGLGLPISRSIVRQHGGLMWAESRPREGSSFFFTLPVLVDQENEATDDGDRRTVIVCDDDCSARTVVAEILTERGYRAVPAASGAEAIELASRERPVAILLDLLMPEVSGWETAGVLKSRPDTKDIPIIVLSGLSREERGSLQVSVDGWVEKPISEAMLLEVLEGTLAGRAQVSSVLVVEDDPDLRRVLLEVFENHGLSVAQAQTGRQAISETERLVPDVLVLDLGLPDGDGFTVADWVHEHERFEAVPIVVYTARDLSEEDRARLGPHTEVFLKGSLPPEEFARRVIGLLGRTPAQMVGG